MKCAACKGEIIVARSLDGRRTVMLSRLDASQIFFVESVPGDAKGVPHIMGPAIPSVLDGMKREVLVDHSVVCNPKKRG